MKLKITLDRPEGAVDLVLTAASDATAGDVAAALATRDPGRRGYGGTPDVPVTLSVLGGQRVTLDPDLPLGDSGISSGDRVSVSRAGERYADRAARPVAQVTVVQGPDAGLRVQLPAGNCTIGRGNGCDIRLSDTLVSRRHVRAFLAPGSAEILDLGSANGITLNDEPVTRGAWLPGDRLRVGDTVLGIELAAAAGPGSPHGGPHAVAHAGAEAFNRSPVITPSYAGQALETPELPESERTQRFPLLSMLAPLLIGGVLFAVTKNAMSLIFIALSPLMIGANAIEERVAASRGRKGSMAAFRRELADLDKAAAAAHAAEWQARNAEHPPTAHCLAAAAQRSPLLWSRRPGAPRFLDIRVGAAMLPSRLRFEAQRNRRATPAAQAELDQMVARYQAINDVPCTLSLAEHGSVGIAGDPAAAFDVASAVVCQFAALHSPAEVVLAAFTGGRAAADWDWLKWLPHTSSAHSPCSGPHLVAGPESTVLLGQLEDLVRSRLANARGVQAGAGQHGAPGGPGGPGGGVLGNGLQDSGVSVLVLIDGRTAGDRARLVELSRVGPAAGVYCVWLAQRAEHLPATCTAYVEARGDGTATIGDSRTGTSTAGVAADAVGQDAALAFSRAMAPLTDAGAVVADDSDLPRTVSWLELNDPRIADDPAAVVERWQESRSILTGPAAPAPGGGPRPPGGLRAIVGTAADGPHALDLRLHGPHALVGGTTGAGKSELLQTWILAMAAAHSPQRVTFLLVDYKGGSAFRECVDLPHTVGLVTDLSPHLVRRALVSLGAELTYREHLFARKRVKDLQELEKTGDPETPPSLVIVVDEFAALVHDVPEFVDGMVNVAQRGRSLGLHLVLATQRPTGVIKDNLRANTNLRLALRMADEGDSTDVLGSPEAAYFDPALPGRAVSKTGPGRLVPFQAGYVGGCTSAVKREPDVLIEDLVIGEGRTWPAPERPAAGGGHGPTDIVRITDTIRNAAALAQLPPPRRPWLDDLASVYDLGRLPTRRRDDELVFGVIDEPEQQRQSTVAFRPDAEGNLAVFGTGGAGKSTVLRSLAVAAAITVRGGPCQVYCLDFGARGLDVLKDLPHVGAVIPADEGDRVRRLLRTLLAMLDDRARRYSRVRAGSVTEYRHLDGAPDEPRVLVLLDGFAAFRQQYEMADGGKWLDAFNTIAAEGRPLGIHVIITADRPGALPPRLASRIQRRLTMRLADDAEYVLAGAEPGILTADSPPGRAMIGREEIQVAVLGGSPDIMAQARAISQLAVSMHRQQVADAPPVDQLPEIVRLGDLPVTADGQPAVGLADDTLAPVGFRPEGVFLISGPPASGRTTAVATTILALDRAAPGVTSVFIGGSRSPLISLGIWQQVATGPAEAAELAGKLEAVARDPGSGQRFAVVVEQLTEFLGGPADAPLTAMIKTLAGNGHVVIAEAETSALGQAWPLLNAVKTARTGLALQPEQTDGLMVYKTEFPKSRRSEFPPGRGLLVTGGKVRLAQIAIPE